MARHSEGATILPFKQRPKYSKLAVILLIVNIIQLGLIVYLSCKH